MNINKIQINGFGICKNLNITLNSGINIIKGNNESGKSTIQHYIINSLYNVDIKKKKGISDKEKYLPWDYSNFSGNIEYSLDDGEKYLIESNFKENKFNIYNSHMRDISYIYNNIRHEYDILQKQIGLNKKMFEQIVIAKQNANVYDQESKLELIQKIINIGNTGNDLYNFNEICNNINKKIREEIGSNNTKNKPINILDDNISKLISDRNLLENKKLNINNLYKEQKKLEHEYNILQNKLLMIEDIEKEKNKFEKQEILILNETNINNENKNILNNLKHEYSVNSNEVVKNFYNKKYVPLIICIINLIYIFVLWLIKISVNYIYILPVLISILITIIYYIYVNNKNNIIKKHHYEKNKKEINISEKIKYVKEEIDKREKNIKIDIKNMLNDKKNSKENLLIRYKKYFEIRLINDIFNMDVNKLRNMKKDILKFEKDILIRINDLEHEITNMNKVNTNILEIEEELIYLNEERNKLILQKEEYELGKKILEEAYEEMKNNINTEFNNIINDGIKYLTNGKYDGMYIKEDTSLLVRNSKTNKYYDANLLSSGTIEQINLAFRIGLNLFLCNENLPIILDEAFSYYDDERIRNTLIYLSTKLKNKQIILFTSNAREINILKHMNMKFNEINI